MFLEGNFFSVKTAKHWNRFNVDVVPTLCLEHSKKEVGPKNLEKAAERSQRARDREHIKKTRKSAKKERELEADRNAKRVKLSEPGHQIADINFNFDDEIEENVERKGSLS